MNEKKILFITPPYHCGVVEVAGRWVPLTFVYLAGAAREAGFEPVIYDAMTKRHGFDEIEERIRAEQPRYVATSAITSTAPDAYEVMKIAKSINPDIITLIGGVHPSFMNADALVNGYCDYVIRGEGEETVRELLVCLANGGDPGSIKGIAFREGHRIRTTAARAFVTDLDALSTAWDLVDWNDYRYFVIPGSRLGAVSTSRGCSHNCTFCSQQKFWHQSWRGRAPENVVDEMAHLKNKYGVNVILLPDEYPTSDRERWERLLDLLVDRDLGIYLLMETRAEDILRDRDILHKYRQAGIIHIYIGVEATEQETLDLIKKDVSVKTGMEAIRLIHEHGMITETSFILGFPHETGKSIKKTLELARIYNPDFAHFLALAPWPYADMYADLEPYIVERDFRKYNLIDPVIKPENMDLQDIDRAIIDCYQRFYMGKMNEILMMKDEFKKQYLMRSMKLMMSSSFIVEKLGSLGSIPPKVSTLISRIEGEGAVTRTEDRYMPKVSRSIVINAPLKEVFDYISSPSNWPSFISGLQEISGVSDKHVSSGTSFNWTYKIRGISLRGTGKVVDYEKESKLSLQMHSLMPIRKTLHIRGDEGHSVLSIEVGLTSPGKVMSFLFKMVSGTINIMETDVILSRLKTICEERYGVSGDKRAQGLMR